jgi:hypothetical protein
MKLALALFLCVSWEMGCAASMPAQNDDKPPAAPEDAGASVDDAAQIGLGDAQQPEAGPPVAGGIYANTNTELYRFDPMTLKLTLVAPFTGCAAGNGGVRDIAIDSAGNGYTSSDGNPRLLSKVDLTTGVCTVIKSDSTGNLPDDSLGVVPKGVFDPNAETIVGFILNPPQSSGINPYAKWNTGSGNVTVIGHPDLWFSDDVVSVGNKSFVIATLVDQSQFPVCTNPNNGCLLQIDPKTGKATYAYGLIAPNDYPEGLAFWAGTVYAFGYSSGVYELTWQNNQLVSTKLQVTPNNLHFSGAGSTPAAPPTLPDGGGIPLH